MYFVLLSIVLQLRWDTHNYRFTKFYPTKKKQVSTNLQLNKNRQTIGI